MKKSMIAAVAIAMLATACSNDKDDAKETATASHEATKQVATQTDKTTESWKSDAAKLSYAIGLDVGNSLKTLGTDIDRDAFMEALNAQLDGKTPRLDGAEAAKVKQVFFQKRAAKQAEERKAKGAANKAAGEKFLAENAKKDGVTVTASGLQYEVIRMGDGVKPKATDKVKVHYRGTLLDGTEFDSSYKRGQPISFPLNGVIKGWTEGVQLMPVGSKFKFYIPSDLAYGANGAGKVIGPDSTLIFEVELLAIETPKDVKSAPAVK
ncbi:MAG: FKBP-type peptidyl-prolyl cis-trans isomerase [Mariprofundaceae bacterium]|nr:FKBP-type peptidyl-prolyl cis-trans isomerase [Mariprofundaceae bacterium]